MPTLDAAFYDAVRPLFGGSLSQAQVDGLTLIVNTWNKTTNGDKTMLAYVLATAFHESAQTMQPIAEYGKGKGKPYGKKDSTGKAPYGRGLVQLTWRENYVKADAKLGLEGKLAADYDLALDPLISVRILITGMLDGWFTGKRLNHYITPESVDFKGARRIVNGTDKAALIADHARTFLRALEAVPAQEVPAAQPSAATGILGVLASIIKFILDLLKGLRRG